MIFYYLKGSSSDNMNSTKFTSASLSSLSRRIIAKKYIFSVPYLQSHRERTMADLIIPRMKTEQSGSEVKFSLRQLLISPYVNSYTDAELQN